MTVYVVMQGESNVPCAAFTSECLARTYFAESPFKEIYTVESMEVDFELPIRSIVEYRCNVKWDGEVHRAWSSPIELAYSRADLELGVAWQLAGIDNAMRSGCCLAQGISYVSYDQAILLAKNKAQELRSANAEPSQPATDSTEERQQQERIEEK